MKLWSSLFKSLFMTAFAVCFPFMSFADELVGSPSDSTSDSSVITAPLNAPSVPDSPVVDEDIEMSPWSASLFYLYNFSNDKHLLVPTPGYEKGGFKANAQSASFKFNKVKGFESSLSTNWSIGQDINGEDKLIFKANASVRKRVVIAVPFVEVSKGVSFKTDYSQVSVGASSFIPTPWFYILPKYTATYSNADMNQFEYGINDAGWSAGWGVTLLKPINKNWTFLAIYSGKKVEESIQIDDESKQSVMMILSYQFDQDFKF